jgi:hypothetical protein
VERSVQSGSIRGGKPRAGFAGYFRRAH